ncbi:MAG TPA: hypothetical protein VEK08_21555 [Planctomycetota bacterium]|nr:hypothetical protein [Planctomycetota bacterium]
MAMTLSFFAIFMGLIFYIPYALACNFLFRLMMSSLPVTKAFEPEWRRERMMTFLAFLCVPLLHLGPLVLLVTYLFGALRHFREVKRLSLDGQSPRLPRIPRMRLEEMLVMVFSVGAFPMICNALLGLKLNQSQSQQFLTFMFIVGLMVFPLCFISAYHRLEANHVPHGRTRMLFLLVYPYVLWSVPLILFGLLLIFFGILRSNIDLEIILIYSTAALLPPLIGIPLSRIARREGDAVAARESTEAVPEPPLSKLPPAEGRI